MVEFEADDALAAAAAMAAADARVDQVVVCSPDKDLAQCVRGDRVVQLDRRTRELRDESAVRQKFGVPPASIPDWLLSPQFLAPPCDEGPARQDGH
jgi:5'-3' exonuclease